MNINLHIERLVLDGVNIDLRQGPLLQEALQVELTRLLTERGLSNSLAQGVAMSRLSTADIQLIGNSPTQLGRQIAQSLYGGIGRE